MGKKKQVDRSSVSGRFVNWSDRLVGVTEGADLATAVQADGHRSVVCHASPDPSDRVHFCVPGSCAPAVTYDSSGDGASWVLGRIDERSGRRTFVGRLPLHRSGDGAALDRPQFVSAAGRVALQWQGRDSQQRQLVVYLHPPAGACL